MSQTFIPGYMASISIDSEDLTVVGNVLSIDLTKGGLPKSVFGQQWRNTASGQISGSISVSGHLSVEIAPLLMPLIEAETPIPIVVYMGDEGGAIDGGSNAGNIVVTGLSESADSEGEWEWTIEGELDGALVYTPPTP